MTQYTPTTPVVLAQWIKHRPEGVTEEQSLEAFQRWFDAVKAKARAEGGAREALLSAADRLRNDLDEPWGMRAANRVENYARAEQTGGAS